jgi:O-antigen/teichoic acid export membrane protein
MKKENNGELDKSLKLIVKSSFVIFFMVATSKLLGYAYRVIVARHYGAEVYGMITLTLVIAGTLITAASIGIPFGIAKFVPEYVGKKKPKEIKYILKMSLTILATTSIFAAIFLFVFSDFIAVRFFDNEGLGVFLKIFSFLIPLWVGANFFRSALDGLERVSWSSFLENVVPSITNIAVLSFLIFLGVGAEAVVISYMAAYILLFVVAFVLFIHYTKVFFREKFEDRSNEGLFRKFFSFSWPLVFVGVVSHIFYWADSIIIGLILTVEKVGLYNAAVPIALLFSFAPGIFTKLFFPLINREYSENNITTTKEVSRQVGKWIFMVNFPLLIIILSFAPQLITFIFGSEYIVAANSLRILAVGSFVLAQSNVSEKLILVSGKSKVILKNILITSIIGIFLNLILIPTIGIDGAALSTSIMYLFLSGLLVSEGKKNMLGIIPMRKEGALKITLISFLIFIGLFIAKTFVVLTLVSLMLTVVIVVVVYSALIYLTGCLDKNDIMILRSIYEKVFGK